MKDRDMQHPSEDTIEQLRELMPVRTLNILGRGLNVAEAKVVAERQADLLRGLLDAHGPSVEVERIMELDEIAVEVLPDLPRSGSSQWVKDRWVVQINADDSLWRCRATLAHELKHVLDDPFVEILYPGFQLPRDHVPQAEAVCEYFAGCLLVPGLWLRQAWEHGQRQPATLASRFDVSEALIRVRLRQTGLTAGSTPRRTWHRRSTRPYGRQKLRMQRRSSMAESAVRVTEKLTSAMAVMARGSGIRKRPQL